ncbi:MAG TPA: tetratricopeptide repeat protein [Stellaceae bacterium]|nr:tetratricopeptide repeat protein [Stellaceae bacterium]
MSDGLAPLASLSPGALRSLLTGDSQKAAKAVALAARRGIVEAQLRLGRMLLDGTGIPRDEHAAFGWFMTAARDGDADGMNMVGRCYEQGWGVAVDYTAAARWYRKAAERGHAWAQYNLGHLYLDGVGVFRDPRAAFAWYWKAAAQGHARALSLVGRCFEEGWGVSRDPKRAAEFYRRSAEGGYFRGQYNWATVLLRAGRADEAATWFARAAAGGTEAVREAVASIQREHPELLTGIAGPARH